MPYDSPMTALKELGRRNLIPIVDTEAVDNPGGTKAIGQFEFDPVLFGLRATYELQAVVSTSKGSITGSVQLYNLTDGEAVTNGLISTSSTTPTHGGGGSLIVGVAAGNLKPSSKVYEVRISVTGSDASDILSVGSVRLQVV